MGTRPQFLPTQRANVRKTIRTVAVLLLAVCLLCFVVGSLTPPTVFGFYLLLGAFTFIIGVPALVIGLITEPKFNAEAAARNIRVKYDVNEVAFSKKVTPGKVRRVLVTLKDGTQAGYLYIERLRCEPELRDLQSASSSGYANRRLPGGRPGHPLPHNFLRDEFKPRRDDYSDYTDVH